MLGSRPQIAYCTNKLNVHCDKSVQAAEVIAEDVAQAVESTAATIEAVADTPMEGITVTQTQAPNGETVIVTETTEPTRETTTIAEVSTAEPQVAEVRLSPTHIL